VDFSLSSSQKIEADKLIKYIKQMEGIIRTSPNKEQVERVKKEIRKYRDKLGALVPGLNVELNSDQIRAELKMQDMEATPQPAARTPAPTASDMLSKFPIQKASPHSSDNDVNFVATVLTIVQKEYWPAISEQHCKLDFSNSAERDTIRNQLDNSMRNLKVLAETIEEYSMAEKQDFREQLLKMKNKQTRIFLYETNQTLKKIRDFLKKLMSDVKSGGNSIINKTDVLKFNPKFEEATVLEGAPIVEALVQFEMYASQAVERINLPELKVPNS